MANQRGHRVSSAAPLADRNNNTARVSRSPTRSEDRRRKRRGKKKDRTGDSCILHSSVSARGLCIASITTTTCSMEEREEQESSVLSEYDVLNDAIQEFLLDTDDDDESTDFDHITIFHAVKPFLNCSRGPADKRARKSCEDGRAPRSLLPSRSIKCDAILSPGLTLAEAMLPAERRGRRCRRGRRTLLPSGKGLPRAPLCVVVDLDETLVSARGESVHPRPYVKEFLDTCHMEGCEVVVWSAGTPLHVNNVVRVLAGVSQRRDWYHHIISRHHKWYRDEEGVKDLSVLGRPLNRVLMLENSPRSIQRQPEHSVLVEDYVQPMAHDNSLRLVAELVRRLVAALKGTKDSASLSVPLLLSVDTALLDISLPSSHSPQNEGAIMSKGLRYSPRAAFEYRSYGGDHPLILHE